MEKGTAVIRTYDDRDSSYPLPRILGNTSVVLKRLAIRKRDRNDSVRYEEPGHEGESSGSSEKSSHHYITVWTIPTNGTGTRSYFV
jgi:hypothetical protein